MYKKRSLFKLLDSGGLHVRGTMQWWIPYMEDMGLEEVRSVQTLKFQVRVVFPFEAPEAWGVPSEIENDSLYAVFADENGELKAYKAEYDPETGEVSFETDQTGDFAIVQFKYKAISVP